MKLIERRKAFLFPGKWFHQLRLRGIAGIRIHRSSGEMFRNTNAETIQLTLAERLWQLIIDVLADLAELIEIDTELLMEKLIADNQIIIKLTNYTTLVQAG